MFTYLSIINFKIIQLKSCSRIQMKGSHFLRNKPYNTYMIQDSIKSVCFQFPPLSGITDESYVIDPIPKGRSIRIQKVHLIRINSDENWCVIVCVEVVNQVNEPFFSRRKLLSSEIIDVAIRVIYMVSISLYGDNLVI